MSRFRTRLVTNRQAGSAVVIDRASGNTVYADTQTGEGSVVLTDGYVEDEFGVRNGAFTAVRGENGRPINGEYVGGDGYIRRFTNWYPQYYHFIHGPDYVGDGGRPDVFQLASQVISRTNPSGAVVDVPVALAELRELPALVKKFGDGLLKNIADGNLRYEFGIKPMINDLKGLLNFQKQFDNRMKLYKKLQTSPMCRKSGPLYNATVEGSGGRVTAHSAHPLLTFSGTIRTMTQREYWGYCNWTPSEALLKAPKSDEQLAALARRAVLGLTLDASTVWNLVPWSWLVDWFSNVGEFLENQRRIIDVYPDNPAICFRATHTAILTIDAPDYGMTGVTVEQVTHYKNRTRVSAALPSAYLPLLTGRQVGILSSLAALRSR